MRDLKHPNIIRYLSIDVSKEKTGIDLLLEYVPGGSIKKIIDSFGSFGEKLIKVYTRQILTGLNFIHEQGITHRDLKCSNILVDDNGVIKLSDFGFSKQTVEALFGEPKNEPQLEDLSRRSSLNWIAPEVFQGREGQRQDIWSLGCCLLEMISGHPPFHDCDPKTLPSKISELSEPPPYPESISTSLRSFLDACFELHPQKRPNAFELLCHPFVLLNNQREVRESLDAVNSIKTYISF